MLLSGQNVWPLTHSANRWVQCRTSYYFNSERVDLTQCLHEIILILEENNDIAPLAVL